jgi:hypothetical protein
MNYKKYPENSLDIFYIILREWDGQ